MTQLMEQKNPQGKMNTQHKRPQRTQRFTKPSHQHNNRSSHGQSGRSLLAQRNTLQQHLERYLSLARDAKSSGDRVLAESYYQYVEHYFRSLNEIKALIDLETPKKESVPQEEPHDSETSQHNVQSDEARESIHQTVRAHKKTHDKLSAPEKISEKENNEPSE